MDLLVGVGRWKDLSAGSVVRRGTLLWGHIHFKILIRETGMAPFPRISKVRTHESSIILNSAYAALSVNYMAI